MTDLTAITTPFGLLDAETQEALKAHGGPYEMYAGGSRGWEESEPPAWFDYAAIRVKPAPPKPREFYLGCSGGYRHVYDTREAAQTYVDHNIGVELIHVREVLE